MSTVGVAGFADVISQVGGLTATTASFASASAVATAAAITPPGNDLDSTLAVAQQNTNTASYIAALGTGLKELTARAADTTATSTTFEALQQAGGVAVAAI